MSVLTPEAVYPYVDEAGDLLFEVCRMPDKRFMQRRRNGSDYVWALNGTRRVLFHLPRVLEHVSAGARTPLYVVEGEKDVLAIEAAGGVATCNPMGAGKWTAEYSEPLAGARRVVIVADRDEPGVRHAESVRESLAEVGVAAEIVQAAEGKDAADHLAAGKTLDEFVPLQSLVAPLDDDAALFAGLTHDEVLQLDLPPDRYLVDDLVPVGAVGTIAGVPETHKTFLAHAIAVRVARGEGEILGCQVARQARVGYFWQDDSTREEAERVKLFERTHSNPDGLPLRWFLNEGLTLPRDLGRLRATIEQLELELAILDSFYNVVSGIDLKAEVAEQVVARLKAEIADPTGCAVLIVDHMPWATETNRLRLRAYGGVFKNAATRYGIYIEAQGKKLYVETRGNNIRGFKKTPAYWDDEQLELRLVDTAKQEENEAELDETVLSWLREHPGRHSTSAVREAIPKRAKAIDEALERLEKRTDLVPGDFAVKSSSQKGGTWSGRPGAPRYWEASNHAGSTSSQIPGTTPDDLASQGPREPTSSRSSHPYKGDEVGWDDLSDDDFSSNGADDDIPF